MIKVLIIDDDRLVRRGLISSMPWQAFDMEVVGEASNGEKALEFLATHEVDLIMVDLEMPVMSGIELMRVATRRYPRVYIVVLTFHQDFEYIQEALRLGAIDYIVKAQLEKERFEEVLGRISKLIKRELSKTAQSEILGLTKAADKSDQGFVLISTGESLDFHWLKAVPAVNWVTDEIGDGLWLCIPDNVAGLDQIEPSLLNASHEDGWVLMRISGLRGENRITVQHLLHKYCQNGFFYSYDPTKGIQTLTVASLDSQPPTASEEEIRTIRERCLALQWVHKGSLFEALLVDLKKTQIPVSKLFPLLLSTLDELRRLCKPISPLQISSLEKVANWIELEKWLRAVREQAFKALCRQPYAQDVVGSIFAAVKMIDSELENELSVRDVARRVNMSRSYFSQCFKDITGKPFNDFLRQARLERAREYLVQTDKPVKWVIEHTGYKDDKYFNHIFQEQTGMHPSEFRRNSRVGR
jgi:two-component system response regulator YesN